MGDDFFDAFGDGIEVDWSKITDQELDQLVATLNTQKVNDIFEGLKSAIDTNNKRKSIVNITLQVLQVAVKLGMKVA